MEALEMYIFGLWCRILNTPSGQAGHGQETSKDPPWCGYPAYQEKHLAWLQIWHGH